MDNKKKIIVVSIAVFAIVIIVAITLFVLLNINEKPIDTEKQNSEIIDNKEDKNTPIDTSGISEMDDSELEKYN